MKKIQMNKIKNILIFFLLYIKMVNIIKKTRKASKRSMWKVHGNLSWEEKDKKHKYAWERYQNFTEKQNKKSFYQYYYQYYQECKQNLPEYKINYYLAHKK